MGCICRNSWWDQPSSSKFHGLKKHRSFQYAPLPFLGTQERRSTMATYRDQKSQRSIWSLLHPLTLSTIFELELLVWMMWYRPIVHISVKLVESWVSFSQILSCPTKLQIRSNWFDTSCLQYEFGEQPSGVRKQSGSMSSTSSSFSWWSSNSVHKFPQTRTFAVSEALFCLQTRIHYECSADNCFSMQLLREAYIQANFKEGMLMDETHQRGTSDEETCMNASVQCLACAQNLLNAYM